MYNLEFKLKQHTPLIHFQHDQDGATLRATEVKPKLDRFIIESLGDGNYAEGVKVAASQGWLIGKYEEPNTEKDKFKTYALDYKMRIDAKDKNEELSNIEWDYATDRGVKKDTMPTYFGLMGKDIESDNYPKFVLHNVISLQINCFHKALLENIDKHLAVFFIRTNFGTRQSKGFGSFYPLSLDLYPIKPLKYFFDVDISKTGKKALNHDNNSGPSNLYRTYQRLFDIISLFYSTLRSGINQNWGSSPIYFKSMMFMYSKNKLHIQWDKKTIKENFYYPIVTKHKTKYPDSEILNYTSTEKYLMRDLLGLASESKWFAEYRDTISTTSDEVERFKSPIVFKPLETETGKFRVYFEGNQDALNEMFNKRFKVSNAGGKEFTINTPPKDKFIIDNYLRYAFSIDLDKHIINKSKGGFSADVDLLKGIYKQIRNNAGIKTIN